MTSRLPLLLLVLLSACAATAADDASSTTADLTDHAGLDDASPEARAIIALANDRRVSTDDFVTKVGIAPVTANAIVAVRNGVNARLEAQAAPTNPFVWNLAGDDESFEHIAELDALPGTDGPAFQALRSYAVAHGYVEAVALGAHRFVLAATDSTCVLERSGDVRCWGDQLNTTMSGPFLQDSLTGAAAACALRLDGTASCLQAGDELAPKPGVFETLAVGPHAACGLRPGGAIECWGGALFAPGLDDHPGRFEAVSVGFEGGCAIRADDHQVECWTPPSPPFGLTPPSGVFKSVSVGDFYKACGIRADDTIACWGRDDMGVISLAPPGKFLTVSVASSTACALAEDHTIHCWGANNWGEGSPPAETFRQFNLGSRHGCGIRDTDEALLCWGYGRAAQVPAGF